MKAARDGMLRRHHGPRLLRAVSNSLADQCPPPDTEISLTRLQAAARDRGLLRADSATPGLTAAAAPPRGRNQPRPPDAEPDASVITAHLPRSRLRRQQRRARTIAPLAAATAVALIAALTALLAPHGHHRAERPPRPPAASPAPSPSPALPSLREITGTWTGRVVQTSAAGTVTVNVKMTVPAHSRVARISYYGYAPPADFSCSDRLFPISALAGTLVLRQTRIAGPCNPGTVTLIYDQGSGSLAFVFQGSGAPPATGTLTRKKR